MRPLSRVYILSVVAVMFLWSGVSFGHDNFNPDFPRGLLRVNPGQASEPCVGTAGPFCEINWYFYEYRGDSHCQEHWTKHFQEQQRKSEGSPGNDGDDEQTSSDMDGEDDSTITPGTEPNTQTITSDPSNAEPGLRQSSGPTGKDCEKFTESECVKWDFHTYPYAGLPIIPYGVETVGHLWHYWRHQTNNKNFMISLMNDGKWEVFKGSYTSPLYDTPITPHLGISLNRIKTAYAIGKPVAGEKIELVHPDDKVVSVHLVGFPEVPANYKRLSDIAEVDGVDWVQRRIRKDDRLRYEAVYGAGDTTDDLIVRGQAVMIRIRKTVTLDLKGEMPEVATAPSVSRKLTTSWGHIKMHNAAP